MGRRPAIPEKIKLRLWVLAGGRCQYEGCNTPLWRDDLTLAQMNAAYIGHIIDVNPKTHRYDPILSPKLASDISNLMLLCDKHHRLIDHEEEQAHTVDRLIKMKAQHETRIELLTSLSEERKSHIILYGANIGEQNASLSWEKAAQAMIPRRYPAEPRAIELSLGNSAIEDHTNHFWDTERRNLQIQFNNKIKPRVAGSGDIEQLSIFAFAPIPLLIELGRLLSDIPAAEVYQLHREPPDWKWQERYEEMEFIVEEPRETNANVALNLSFSANILNSRISVVFPGKDLSIWRMFISTPHNDFLKSREQLRNFRKEFRRLLDRIKVRHGQNAMLNIFPAIPVSVAVEIGRVWMPKADLPLCIYDQNRKLGGFIRTLEFPVGFNQEV